MHCVLLELPKTCASLLSPLSLSGRVFAQGSRYQLLISLEVPLREKNIFLLIA